jgi:hypothetical protein
VTSEEHLENTVSESGEDDAAFDVYLPVNDSMDETSATHVAHMRGNENGFRDVLAGFVASGSELSAPLRQPITDTDLDSVRLALEGLGPARLEDIEPT